jgi:hypothetical protein
VGRSFAQQNYRRSDVQRHVGGDEDRRGVLGFRRVREFVRKMGRRGRPEVLALQLPQGPEQLAVTNLGPASKLLQEGGQECVALQHNPKGSWLGSLATAANP